MRVFFGNTLVGFAAIILIGAVLEVVRMFMGIYHFHGFIGLIVSIALTPLTLITAPLYFALQHGNYEFLWQIYLFPVVGGLMMFKGYDLAGENVSFAKGIIGAIIGLIAMGFIAGMIQA